MSQFHVQAHAKFRRRLYGPAGLRAIDAQLASVFPNSTKPPDMRRLHFIKTWADTQRGLMSWAERELGPSYHRLRVEDVYVREEQTTVASLLAWLGRADVPGRAIAALLREGTGKARKFIVKPRDRRSAPFKRWVELVAGDVLDSMGYFDARGARLEKKSESD